MLVEDLGSTTTVNWQEQRRKQETVRPICSFQCHWNKTNLNFSRDSNPSTHCAYWQKFWIFENVSGPFYRHDARGMIRHICLMQGWSTQVLSVWQSFIHSTLMLVTANP